MIDFAILFVSHVAILLIGYRMGRTSTTGAALIPKNQDDQFQEAVDLYDEERLDYE